MTSRTVILIALSTTKSAPLGLLRCVLLVGETWKLSLAGVALSDASADEPDKIYISRQGGASIYYYSDDENILWKEGARVQQHEEVAMRLVAERTDVPLPRVIPEDTAFFPSVGSLAMSRISGSQLNTRWDALDHGTKERVCNDIWSLVAKLRAILKPPELEHLFQCSADGTATSSDPLIEQLSESATLNLGASASDGNALEDQIRRNFAEMGQHIEVGEDGSMSLQKSELNNDTNVRLRVYQRYLYFNGRLHAGDLPFMLPHSTRSVFTHGDLCPRNILVNESLRITGIVDWEAAGWYPEYWEYINMWKPSGDTDWQEWMDRTAPVKWDRSGIDAARKVLF